MASAAASCFHTSSEMATPVRRYESALTSNSSNSKSAPAARSTLIASGTTSLPAPSQGRTAMCLGRCGFLFTQLVALDLAGHGLRELGDELDHVRILKALEPRFAVLLKLRDQRNAGHRVWPRDDKCLDLGEAVERDADDSALRDSRVLEQRRLDLDRRDPQSADLDHVVRAALVPVVALVVDAVAVAREKPFAEDRPLGLLVLRPIEREGAVAFDVEVARLALRHRVSFFVKD